MSIRAWDSLTVVVSGFSTITCSPACRHRAASAKCVDTGVAMATASGFRSRSSSADATRLTCGYARAAASSRAALASQTAATSVNGQVEKLRTRFGPQYPYPMIPTRRRSMIPSGRCSYNVRELVLGLAEVQATCREDDRDERGRQGELAPRDLGPEAHGPEAGDQPGQRVQVQ